MTTTNTTEVERVSNELLEKLCDLVSCVSESNSVINAHWDSTQAKMFERGARQILLQHLRSSHSALVEENEDYKETLEFYAKDDTYWGVVNLPVVKDRGSKARVAIAKHKEEN